MTTIAYDGRYVASDTQTTVEGYSKVLGTKMLEVPGRGEKLWLAGDCDEMQLYSLLLVKGIDTPECKFELVEGFLFQKNKLWYCSGRHFKMEVLHPFAVGSGKDLARMAMHLGKSAEEAVKLASIFDSNTNELVEVFDTKTKRRTASPALGFTKKI